MLSSYSVTCTSCINFHREFSGQDPGFVPIHALHTWKYAIWGHWRHSSAQSFQIHYIDTRTATLIYDFVFSPFWLCIATRLCILSHNALCTVAAFLFLDRTILIGHRYLLATRQLNKYSNFIFLREGFFFSFTYLLLLSNAMQFSKNGTAPSPTISTSSFYSVNYHYQLPIPSSIHPM